MTSFNRKAWVPAILMMAVLALPAAGAPERELDKFDKGPKVGAAIPHALSAVDQYGQHRDFKSLARRRGLIILFNRSLDW